MQQALTSSAKKQAMNLSKLPFDPTSGEYLILKMIHFRWRIHLN